MTTFTLDESMTATLPTHFQTFDGMMEVLMDVYIDFREMQAHEVSHHISARHISTASIPRGDYLNA